MGGLAVYGQITKTHVGNISELVTNGTFDTNTTGWSVFQSSVLSVVSGRMRVTNGVSSQAGRAVISLGILSGNFSFSMDEPTGTAGSAYMYITSSSSGSTTGIVGTDAYEGSPKAYRLAGINYYLVVGNNDLTNSVYTDFDNISVKQKGNIVAYSGFSADNYLEQTGFPSLSGDFYVMLWTESYALDQEILTIDDGSLSAVAPTNGLHLWGSGSALKVRVGGAVIVTSAALSSGTMSFMTIVKKAGVIYSFINANEDSSATSVNEVTDSVLTIGKGFYGGFSQPTSLLRIGAGAPSAPQITEIYNFEKHLFQDNNACTLSGTSDDVKALAFDSDTKELYVASATDLSVFVGGVRTTEENAAYTSLSAIGGQNAKGN